ncbi:MAG: hypothetical protein K6G27_15860 [Lachnospiraceae bacterium]|nr:hypothetical protein [Lachnospiraceae bacterium]
MTGKISKMQRQVLLLTIFSHEESIIDLEVINKNTPIDIRTLQRDINELTAAGFLEVRFNKRSKCYVGEVYIPHSLHDIDEKKRKYFEGVLHYERMIFGLGKCLELDQVHDVLFEMQLFEWMYQDWAEECGIPELEPKYSGPVLDNELSADRVYFKMFPDANEKDLKKDIQFLNGIGYAIEYCEELKVCYIDFPEEIEA